MIQQSHNDREINLEVLQKLKLIVCSDEYHSDLKVIPKINRSRLNLSSQPENILVDYEVKDENVTSFKMVVADWGSSWVTEEGGTHMGGTPVYAGPNTYNQYNKDLFSFGRLAMELMMDKSGTESKYKTYFYFQ